MSGKGVPSVVRTTDEYSDQTTFDTKKSSYDYTIKKYHITFYHLTSLKYNDTKLSVSQICTSYIYTHIYVIRHTYICFI